jgi:hypothetical protein
MTQQQACYNCGELQVLGEDVLSSFLPYEIIPENVDFVREYVDNKGELCSMGNKPDHMYNIGCRHWICNTCVERNRCTCGKDSYCTDHTRYCDLCGTVICFITIYRCKHIVHPHNAMLVERCGIDVCAKCIEKNTCSICGDTACPQHQYTCQVCGDNQIMCHEHISTCGFIGCTAAYCYPDHMGGEFDFEISEDQPAVEQFCVAHVTKCEVDGCRHSKPNDERFDMLDPHRVNECRKCNKYFCKEHRDHACI